MAELRWKRSIGPAEVTKISVGPMDNNVYLLAVGDEALLVDGSNEASEILSELGPRKLRTIVQTHGHGDHIMALPELVEATGAVVLCHPDDQSMMPVATEALADGQTVSIGPVTLEVRHTPGHTAGSVSLVCEADGQTHLFSGDTLFPGGPGGTFGDTKAFETIMRSLEEKLFVLPDPTGVYPGHGDDTTIGTERPSIEEWRGRGW
jgi:glyoxylase-like metal-dependent hydrolase (beta-lactamase superfamily II)